VKTYKILPSQNGFGFAVRKLYILADTEAGIILTEIGRNEDRVLRRKCEKLI
jgi:hypothetical protein